MTHRFKAGEQEVLSNHIRKSAVTLISCLNELPGNNASPDPSRRHSLLSVASVLEVYLQQAMQFSLIKEPVVLQKKIQEVKTLVERYCCERID